MGFLHKLWDETMAGPAPESGLGKLRKCNSFSAVRLPNHPFAGTASRSFHDHHRDLHHADGLNHRVSRSITIMRTRADDPGSGASSPTLSCGSESPSPLARTPRDSDVKRFTRKKQPLDAMDHSSNSAAYDWIMISALDR